MRALISVTLSKEVDVIPDLVDYDNPNLEELVYEQIYLPQEDPDFYDWNVDEFIVVKADE